jgi:protein-disulfide isomerase
MPDNLPKTGTNQFLVILLIIAAFAIGILWQRTQNLESKSNEKDTQVAGVQEAAKPTTVQKVQPLSDKDHIRGDKNASITWIEYSDLECSYCASIHENMLKLMKEYDGKVKWVYRHFPLDQIHPNARKLAIGSECASQVGGDAKFWEYIDYVFANKSTDPSVVASAIGVSGNQFTTCLSSTEIADKVKNDQTSGASSGVQGTPANFVVGPTGNQELIPGALPYEQLKATVDKFLQG